MGKCHCVNALIYLKVLKDERVQNMKGVPEWSGQT